jgi:hypothetical protein
MRRTLSSFVIAGLLLAVPAASLAQTFEFEPAPGPGWSFTPAVAVGWLWDNNVALVNEGFQQDIRGDHLLIVQPTGELGFRGKYTDVRGAYSGTVRRHRDLGALNSFDQRLRASLAHRATARFSLFGRYGFSALPTTEETELNGVPFRRQGTQVHNASGGIEARLDKFTTLRGSYEFVRADFDREELFPTFVIGGRSHGLNAELSRRMTGRVSLGGLYEVRFAEIDTHTGLDEPITFQIGGGTVGLKLGPNTDLSFAGGLSTLSDQRLVDTSIGPFVRASLKHALERATLSAGYERSFVPTFGFGAAAMTEQAFASVLMPVARNRAYIQSSTRWRRNNPELENEPPLQSFWLNTTVGYGLARTIRVEGYYIVAWQDTRLAGGRVNRQRVGAQVVLSAPMRIH